MDVHMVETEELGDRSYIVHEDGEAVVIDPQRDIDRFEDALDRLGVTCRLVLETHLHNDYVSGGSELARRTGAVYGVPGGHDVTVDHKPVGDGDQLEAGPLRVRVVGTPGHTDEHVSYLVDNGSGTPAVFSGGSLLYGSVGRTDLVDPARTEELTRRQFHSARRLADEAPADALLYPTHGFGSFCSSGAATGGDTSTIGNEQQRNDAFTAADEDSFVERLVAGLSAYPRYYAHMGAFNRAGAPAIDLSPPEPVDAHTLRQRLEAGEWVVDLRSWTAYAADHLAGTISIGLAKQFATYVGWLMPWGERLTLIGDDPGQVTEAQRQLVRIGIDRPHGAAVGTLAELADGVEHRGYPRATFADLAAEPNAAVLDVRRHDERASAYLPGSCHLPLHDLLDKIHTLPEGTLWVHCASGYRASIAASLLERAGRSVVLVDEDFTNAVGVEQPPSRLGRLR